MCTVQGCNCIVARDLELFVLLSAQFSERCQHALHCIPIPYAQRAAQACATLFAKHHVCHIQSVQLINKCAHNLFPMQIVLILRNKKNFLSNSSVREVCISFF